VTWANHPIAGVDTESTGVDVESDRIVTAAVIMVGDKINRRGWIINPGVPIPEAATAVHGVTDDDVQASGMATGEAVAEIIDAINMVWAVGAPLAGHNIVYDLTILDRESRRHLGQPIKINGPVFDTLVMDKIVDTYRSGSRKLGDVCTLYGVDLADAHTAAADCEAAILLARRLAATPIKTKGPFQGRVLADLTLPRLHAYLQAQYAEQRRSFNDYLRRQGKPVDSTSTDWPIASAPERQAA
jgi:DNA polymerase-3 subunit epsilon